MKCMALSALLFLAASLAPAAPAQQAQVSWRPAWLAAEINGAPAGDTIAVITQDNRLWLDRGFVADSRFVMPADRAPREFLGRLYYSFDELIEPGSASWTIDERRQVLAITADPQVLRPTEQSIASAPSHTNVPSEVGAFLNYDVSRSTIADAAYDSGLFELSLFRGPVAITSNTLALRDDTQSDVRRLDSALVTDFPERRATLTIGDTIASAGQWGQAVRLGGVQWATNFATQPDLLTLPLATISGEASVPSVVDVFVDGSLAATRNVAAGPFAITELPIVSGSGEIVARVRDALGREQLISQRFYTSPQLLRPGLDAYAFELGKLREHYATAFDRYGTAFAQGTWRRGFEGGRTGEVRAQASENHWVAGAGIAQELAGRGILQLAAARSHAERDGLLLQAGYELDTRTFSAGAQVRWSDAAFRELGDTLADTERLDITAHAGWSTRLGSIGAAVVRRERRDRATIASATYSRTFGTAAFVNVTVNEDLQTHESIVFASITRLLGGRRSAELAVTSADGENSVRAEVRRNRTGGPGVAYGVQTQQGAGNQISADVEWQTSAVTLGAEAAHRYGASGLRASARGAVAAVGGNLAPLPWIDDNFAILDAPALPDMPIFHDNRIVARTDANGRASIAGLRPYERNELRIDPADVPLDRNIEQSRIEVVPYSRGGVALNLRIEKAASALLKLERPDGKPIAPGTRALVGDHSYPIGLDGVVFVPDARDASVIVVQDREAPCSARIDGSALKPLPEKIVVVCQGGAQ